MLIPYIIAGLVTLLQAISISRDSLLERKELRDDTAFCDIFEFERTDPVASIVFPIVFIIGFSLFWPLIILVFVLRRIVACKD